MTKDGDDSQSKKTTKLAKQNQARNSKPSMVTLGQLFPILNQHIQVSPADQLPVLPSADQLPVLPPADQLPISPSD